ncbi:uncharacterized protein N0V89_010099 [Didymosphaeria variabile]|uniref:Helicase ATP-binding domain-containing protein n=1 Tax=Didymosphaeria variabile TaxID=1932322 RepID=A0A9W8XEL2_9PLEO|nr:uncharacterized protein N0V89_010099 [Didymosphaeria variabile]KAJ4348721.1 hypothetical protein N0V89_010099 [Didymosphaeria variabile]
MHGSKRPRLNPVEEVIKATENIRVDGRATYTVEKADCPSLVHLLQHEIRPGTGLAGTKEEEIARATQQEDETEVANGESRGEVLETGSACTSGENDVESEEGEEEDLDGVEEDATDILVLPDGGIMHVAQYFGPEYEARIRRMGAIKPMACPPSMPTRPHDYQLKGATQLTHLCESDSRGALLGDPMGLGKPLTVILHLWAIRNIPGQSLVLCPASLCAQWVKAIEEAFEDGHGLTAFHYADARMAAHQVEEQGVDVVVASYETFERNMRTKLKTEETVLEMVANQDASASTNPKRPTCGLASDLGYYTYRPYKRVILDEVQNVNNGSQQSTKRLRGSQHEPSSVSVAPCHITVGMTLEDTWTF